MNVPELTKTINADKNQVTLQWDSIAGAEGYVLKRSETLSGAYTQIYQTEDASVTSYVDKDVVSGKVYYYKIYRLVNGVENELSASESLYVSLGSEANTNLNTTDFTVDKTNAAGMMELEKMLQ